MDLRARLATLIAVRVVVSTLLLGSGVLVQLSRPDALPATPYFYLIAAAYAMSVINLIALRHVEVRPWFADAQLGGDALFVTAFITVTGGVTSVFSSLYLLPVIAASTVRGRRGALQVAALSALVFCAVVLWQYEGSEYFALVAEPGPLPPVRQAQYTVGINLFGFMAAALVSGALAENAKTADARFARASMQMADLRAFNAHVVDSLLSGLATTDAQGRVTTINRAAGMIIGIELEAVAGREVAEVLQLPEAFIEDLRALQDGRSLRLDLAYRTPGRGVIDLGLSVTTLVFPDAPRGWLFTFQDVTDLRRLERDARLRQRLAAVGEMAAGIAHEIRNPLASMSGSIQVLRSELTLNAEQSELMDIVLRESARLNDTIRSFLEYARPQRFAVARLDVRRAAQDAALLLRNSAEVKPAHAIVIDVPDRPVWCEADEHQIRQIVWNLATNGLRAMPQGGRLTLRVAAHDPEGRENEGHEREGSVVLEVEDTGRGMTAEERDGLFQPFRSSFERGTGLGLAIVHRVVTDYGGRIEVRSAPGSGTVMSVHLPVARPQAQGTVQGGAA